MKIKFLCPLAALLLSGNLAAVNIQVGDLPAELQGCHMSGSCFVDLSSFMDVPNTSGSTAQDGTFNPYSMSAFNLIDPVTGRWEYLLRYNLVQPSVSQITDIVQPLTGSVWLRMRRQYDLNNTDPQAGLYFDQVDPLPGNMFFGSTDGLTLEVALSESALSGGSGYERVGCCTEPSYSGNMSLSGDFGAPALTPCVAEGCYASARLDLLYLLFADPDGDGVYDVGINPLDMRGQLFKVSSYDPYGGLEGLGEESSISYYVSTVPVPPALGLFLSGLGLLGGMRCRQSGKQ